MDGNVRKDSRFDHIPNDPRFRRIPKAERKVKIDKRFQSMFDDGKFKLKYTVDKRGRPINHTTNEDLRRFYDLSSEESGSDSSDDEDASTGNEDESDSELNVKPKPTSKPHTKGKSSSTNESETVEVGKKCLLKKTEMPGLSTDIVEKLHDTKIDYARGEGVLLSDSSSDESSDEDVQELEHGWGELDRDAERTDDMTHRLAVCNMDWDRIRASDFMVLFNSFLPPGGLIHSVTIYPSEFGLERMQKEDQSGPIELCGKDDETDDAKDSEFLDDESKAGEKHHNEKLRQYQLNRLKYYYAVVVFDSPSSANKVYVECDGMEYESSATRLDLRFIPEDTTFDQEPHEVCDQLPEPSKYAPRLFSTTALQQAKVDLTWDETDPARVEMTQKILSGKADDADLQAYLASSSGEEEEEKEKQEETSVPCIKVNGDDGGGEEENDGSIRAPVDPISRYRALLQGIEEEEVNKKSRTVDLEITWGVGLKDKTQKLVDKKLKEGPDGLTPFQQLIEKKKEKKRLKREERKKKMEKSDNDEDNPYSDDDIPSDVDMNDPYFAEEFKDLPSKSKMKKKNKKNKGEEEEENEETKQKRAELELLLMDEDDNKQHFSLKKIQEQESTTLGSKKKRKKMKKKAKEEGQIIQQDDFQVNVEDERFSALFSSHHFNIDPADPHYRKTKGMEALRTEKLKRRTVEGDVPQQMPSKMSKLDIKQRKDAELSLLVSTVKRKTKGALDLDSPHDVRKPTPRHGSRASTPIVSSSCSSTAAKLKTSCGPVARPGCSMSCGPSRSRAPEYNKCYPKRLSGVSVENPHSVRTTTELNYLT